MSGVWVPENGDSCRRTGDIVIKKRESQSDHKRLPLYFLTLQHCKIHMLPFYLMYDSLTILFFCFLIHYVSFFSYLQVKSNEKQSRMSLTEDGIFHIALVHLMGNT
jgi:hypothetical protein